MRSDTYLSIAEFVEHVGGDPWGTAQIDRYDETSRNISDEVMVMVEKAHYRLPDANNAQRAQTNSRQHLIQALKQAEKRFVDWCDRYPIAVDVNETHELGSAYRHRHGTIAFKPKFNVMQFGSLVWSQIGDDIAITRDDDGVILNTFTMTVSVADDTVASDVHVYITSDDGSYTGQPTRNEEIRPLSVVIDSSLGTGNWSATITGSAYLFVKPSLYMVDPAFPLDHALDTYVESVDVWVSSINPCDNGSITVKNNNRDLATRYETTGVYFEDLYNGYYRPCDRIEWVRTQIGYFTPNHAK